MKILQICNFSAGISGVWTRVLEDSLEFIKRGHDVYVFSSDKTENGQKADSQEILDVGLNRGIDITRFPIKFKMGYALWFDFTKEALDLKPNALKLSKICCLDIFTSSYSGIPGIPFNTPFVDGVINNSSNL